jgi:hypothetical protein
VTTWLIIQLLFIESYELFAIFSLKNDREFTVTQDAIDVKKLKMEYEVQMGSTISLSEVLKKQKVLQGKHYFYGYGSKQILYVTTLEIDGEKATFSLHEKIYEGEIYQMHDNILICSSLGLMKIHKRDEHKAIKIISFISEQHHGNGESIILFGILSRYLLKEDEIQNVFSRLVNTDESSYNKASFKESALIHENAIRPLLYKYEN